MSQTGKTMKERHIEVDKFFVNASNFSNELDSYSFDLRILIQNLNSDLDDAYDEYAFENPDDNFVNLMKIHIGRTLIQIKEKITEINTKISAIKVENPEKIGETID